MFFSGAGLEVVMEYKYVGLHTDSKLSFKTHIKKVSNKVKFSLSNFRLSSNVLSTEAELITV